MQITSNKVTQSLIQQQLLIANEQIANKQTLQAYLQALFFSNLSYGNQLHTKNIRIYKNDHIHQIYTNSYPQKNLPHIILLHGFGGIALNFIRTFQHLKEHYQVHALDMFGMGLSSLGNYSEKFTYQETRHYFVDSLEEWRKASKISQFTLVGHSFGGYIAALYCEKYPGHVKRLVLLSPAGTTLKTKQQIKKQIDQRKSTSFSSKVFMCLAQKIYNINVRPSSIINSCILGNTFIQKVTSGRLKLKDAQKQAWKKYLKAVSKKQQTSQTGFYKLFQWPLRPQTTIEQILSTNKFNFPIQFYFGSVDWMDRTGALRLCKSQKNIICETIQEAGHQLVFDNPLAVVAKILRVNRCDHHEKLQQRHLEL